MKNKIKIGDFVRVRGLHMVYKVGSVDGKYAWIKKLGGWGLKENLVLVSPKRKTMRAERRGK